MYRWWHFWRKVPRVPCPSRSPSVRPVRSHSLPVAPARPSVASALPGVSLFRCFRCYLDRPPASHSSLRHPPTPGVSRFRRIGSHLRRVTQVAGPALWQRAHREQAASCSTQKHRRRLPVPVRRPAGRPRCALSLNPSPNPRRTTAR